MPAGLGGVGCGLVNDISIDITRKEPNISMAHVAKTFTEFIFLLFRFKSF